MRVRVKYAVVFLLYITISIFCIVGLSRIQTVPQTTLPGCNSDSTACTNLCPGVELQSGLSSKGCSPVPSARSSSFSKNTYATILAASTVLTIGLIVGFYLHDCRQKK
jgi:hypothetical protein